MSDKPRYDLFNTGIEEVWSDKNYIEALESEIDVLRFHLSEIANSDLVASNLRCMARHALNNKSAKT